MAEKKTNEISIIQQKKRLISKLAIVSLIFSIAGFVCALPGSYLDALELFINTSVVLLILSLLCIGLSFVFGIVAILVILIRKRTGWCVLITSFILLTASSLFIPAQGRIRSIQSCEHNCDRIYHEIRRYATEHDGKLPNPHDWCDVLTLDKYIVKKKFICFGASCKGDKGPSNYAINPNCKPNSPNDIVLLFETKGGWNQYGGPELISFNNHQRKGANVLFNDGHVEFIKPDEVGKLRWK